MSERIDKAMLFSTAVLLPILVIAVLLFFLWPRHVINVHTFEMYEAIGGDRTMKGYVIKAGEDIEYEINFTKYIDCPAEVTTLLKQVDNGYLYPYPEPMVTRMPIGSHHYVSSWPIPKATPPGMYVIIRTYRHFVNPVQTVTTQITSNAFEVKGKVKDQSSLIKEGNTISLQNQIILKELKKK